MKPNSQPGQELAGQFHDGLSGSAQLSFARYDIGWAPAANQSGFISGSINSVHSFSSQPLVRHSQSDIDTNQPLPDNQTRQAWVISPRGGTTERLSRIPFKPSRPQGHHRHHFDPIH
ncbi:hypothetical protein BDW42DRAFT_164970 [Aspergillus taichungensis]|uniref:Uncharacterized protein n=1 Tax=Aspergillus taichungensis TaxID=482145 RepID=A0A2J5I0Z4_9EURO|nr:hypothetical protein BDW42DRAFT_164970 [Aspergillus taichungensis]